MIKMYQVGRKGRRKVLTCGCLVKEHSVWKSYDHPSVDEGKASHEWIEARRRAAKLAGTVMRFGYNSDSSGGGEWFADAISNFQLFHGLAVSGTLDQATADKIALPVCAHLMFYEVKNKSEHDLAILQGWPAGKNTLYYSLGEGIGSADYEFTHVASAIDKWNNEGKIRFEPATMMHPPDIEIGWTSPIGMAII